MEYPNIVYIMADDMGYGDVGCYNPGSKIPTPNMDRLAAEGIRFTDAHSPSAVCTPTRYGVLTGRDCWRSRLETQVLYGYEPPLIEPDRPTLPSLLKSAGYRTACIGKWHLGLGYTCKPGQVIDFRAPLPWPDATREDEEKIDFTAPLTGGPTELGFDYFFGTSGCSTAQPPYGFIENRHFIDPPREYVERAPRTGRKGMSSPGWEHRDVDPVFADKAVEYIESRASDPEPFFLYLTPSAPHEPCLEETVPEFASGKSAAGPRGDLVWVVDWMVGRVLEALERAGKADTTMVVVTSDNGALAGDFVSEPGEGEEIVRDTGSTGGYRTYGHRSCGDYRGYKSHIWEGGHREPLIVRWPGRVAPGTVSDSLVCLTDFMATCADLTGSVIPEGAAEDSFSFLSDLLGTGPSECRRPFIVHHSVFGVFSLRKGRWKAIFDTRGSGGWPPPRDTRPVPGAPGQLYDMESDPGETVNLWDEEPGVVGELAALLSKVKERGARFAVHEERP